MGSSQSILQELTNQILYIYPFILLFLGIFGCFGNLIIFTTKHMNQNSCVFYFLNTTIFELLTLSFGLISRIADQYGSTLQAQSRIYCKIRYYFALTFPTIASYLLLMATIDRCMSASTLVAHRKFSQCKIAYRVVPLVILICMIACSHTLIFVDHQPSCLPQAGVYSLFYTIFLIGFLSIFRNSLLVLFGIWMIRNVSKIRRQIRQIVFVSQQQQRVQKTNAQFIVIVISQAIVSFVIDVTRLSCYSYYILAKNPFKSNYQQTVDVFIFQFSIILSYINYSESFYTNIMTSQFFRKIFCQTCRRYYHKLIGILTI